MQQNIKNYLVVGAVAVALLLGAWYVSAFSGSFAPTRTFTVSGEGKEIAVPDVAELSFGILTEGGPNLADLQRQNSEKSNRVIAYLKESGVDAKDITTQFYNISPRYQYYSCPVPVQDGRAEPCPPAEIVGYTISQNVLVKVRDLNKTGDILAGVVERGANTVSGPSFTVDDPTELQNTARAAAIAEAKAKARAIARAGGFRLGKLVSLQEGFVVPKPIYLEKGGFGGGGAAPSIEPGSQEVQVTVTLVYEIR